MLGFEILTFLRQKAEGKPRCKIDCLTESNIEDVLSHQQGQAETRGPNVVSPSQAEMTSLFNLRI